MSLTKRLLSFILFFFFNDTATTEIYTLSLHDALPICFITHQQADQARKSPLGLHINQPESSVAPWFQEEVRRELEKRFGTEEVHEAGLRVDTTLDLDLQQTANRAVLDGLAAYERRHGWRGRIQNVLNDGISIEDYRHPDWGLAY